MIKRLTVLAAGVAMAVSSPAMALTFVGFTGGCFGADCTLSSTADFKGITYTNSTFSVTEAGGTAAIGAQAGEPNFNNLGSFSANVRNGKNGTVYDGEVFKLGVTFTQPAGTSPTPGTFTGLLSGTILGSAGGVTIDFSDTPQLFTFDGGSFNLLVNDLSLTPGAPATALTGLITNAVSDNAVPEPATWGMLLLGFAGIGFSMRRRKAENRSQRVRVAYG